MNERIKELASFAHCYTEYDNGSVHDCYEFSEEELQHFVELIAEECISACQTDKLGKTIGAEELIKQRFGIE